MNNYKTYTKAEEALVKLNHKIKDILFKPFLVLLTALHVPPNFIASLSSIVIIGGLVASFIHTSTNIFLVSLWVHFLLNAIDGPLARFQNKASNDGAITDSLTDYLGVLVTTIFVGLFSSVSTTLLILFVVFYLIEVYNILISNLLSSQLEFGFKPRFILYAVTTVDVLFNMTYLPLTYLILCGIMAPIVLLSFVNIYKITK